MSSLLNIIGSVNNHEEQVKQASSDLDEQIVEMYKLGWALAESHLMKAAEEVSGGSSEEKKDLSPEEIKEKLKEKYREEMKSDPSKKEEIKKELGA